MSSDPDDGSAFERTPGPDGVIAEDPPALAEPTAAPETEPPDPVQLELETLREENARLEVRLQANQEVLSELQAKQAAVQVEEQALQAQRLESLGLLAGGIAHDFNNLLTAIMGHAEIAASHLPDEHTVHAYLSQILESSRIAANLTRQMLAYAGKAPFDVRAVDVDEAVRGMRSLMRSSLSKRARLVLDLDGALPPVQADTAQLQQLVMNLALNASDALGEEVGVVRIATRSVALTSEDLRGMVIPGDLTPGQFVCLEVVDDGSGMDAETLARIFDPWFTTKEDGHGLGLSATLGIVRGHRGACAVESARGWGTTFRVYLPITETQVAEPEPTLSEQSAGSGLILVVDDEPAVREIFCQALEMGGYTTLPATNGADALAFYRACQGEIRMVLLDMTLPDMSGMDIFYTLRENGSEVPVLLCSGYAEHAVTEQMGMKGLAGFIQKPVSLKALLAKVREVVG